MARIRTIKPEFFTSEDVVSLSPLSRLLFVALWCEADREGRLVWKPKTFKLRYLPADACDIDELARELIDLRLVILYGDGLAFVPTFRRHQHVNPREAASLLPEPDASVTRQPRERHASPPVSDAQGGRERKGRERKGKEGDQSSLRSDSSSTLSTTEQAGTEPPSSTAPLADLTAKRAERLSAVTGDAIEAYNRILGRPNGLLPSVVSTVGRVKRQRQVSRSLRTAGEICAQQTGDSRVTPEFWSIYFTEISRDDFKSGRQKPGKGHENWVPDFEYLTRDDVMLQVFDRATSEDVAL